MAAMERKHKICSPFFPRRNPLRKTSAEIVSEARQSLRVQSTQRPFTPRDAQRQLFGKSSVRVDHDNRPPSTFSLHAQNFDAPDSRPNSGTRLSPLSYKPKLPLASDVDDAFKVVPKPPSELRKGLTGARTRARLLRAGSLSRVPPVDRHTDDAEKFNSGQKQLSPERHPGTDHTEVRRAPHTPGPRRAACESRIKAAGVDSGVRPSDGSAGPRTEPANDDGATNKEKEEEEEVDAFLQQLEKEAAVPGGSVERLCDLCRALHATLAQADMLGRHCKRRSGILRTLFRLIDLNSAQLNLHITKLCLDLCVRGNNLLNICKLVFQISRSESNDALFLESSIIDSLLGQVLHQEVSAAGEALLYCVGTLKFLSGNGAIRRLLLDRSVMAAAQRLIQRLQAVEETHFAIAGHILVQLTVTLRNLADQPESRPHFVSFSVLPELCVVLQLHHQDQDICTNISRIFSKLSSYSACRLALARTPDCYRLFLELLSKHHQKQDLVVRLLFTLGNLTAKVEEARLQLFQSERCMDTLLRLYDGYQRRHHMSPRIGGGGGGGGGGGAPEPGSPQEHDDVLVKLVAVVANMCIHPAVGPALANDARCIQLLMETVELRSVQESEELLVNVAATINNLSFYQDQSSAVALSRLAITKLMLKLLLSCSPGAMLEATRVYGNMSQSKDVRDFIMQNKVHEFAVTLLDSQSTEVCFSACGLLTNLALDPANRVGLSLEGVSAKLLDCLRDLGPGDWQLAGQLCQALWNLIGGDSEKLLDLEERESLMEVITMYLDEEAALRWIENEDMRDYHKACWELEFFPVARKLLVALQLPEET